MAYKPQSFKVVDREIKKGKNKGQVEKTIILYTNVRIEAETDLINYYLDRGYVPMYEEKKSGMTVAKMREELKADAETLKAFNEAYENKEDKKCFFNACKIYTNWKKENKGKEE